MKDAVLDRIIKQTIHDTFMEGLTEKSVYEMTPEELEHLFERVAFNVMEKTVEHFRGLPAETIRGRLKAIEDGIMGAKERTIKELGLKKKREG